MCSCRGKSLVLDVFLNRSPPQSLKQRLSLNLKLTDSSPWTDWRYYGLRVSHIYLVMLMCIAVPNFYADPINHTQSLLICSHQFTNRAIFPATKKYFLVTFKRIKYINVIQLSFCASYKGFYCISAPKDEPFPHYTPDPSPHTPFSHVTIVPFPFVLGKYLRLYTRGRSRMSKLVSGCQTFFI